MFDHDAAYKSMFSIPRAVEDLLREFIDEEWVEKLDFSTLEQINGSFVTERWRRQMTDVVWKVRLADQELYICLLVEFQSTIDPTMALRVASYVLQLYLDLSKDPKRLPLTPSGKLPPVLPIVMYNGAPRWSAPLELDELIEAGPRQAPRFSALARVATHALFAIGPGRLSGARFEGPGECGGGHLSTGKCRQPGSGAPCNTQVEAVSGAAGA
ncbi:Rpn family recombination-promoting nuclease/putative transposase [Chitinimonas arctica]|uniref:Rpn family recombination-promoting nuclease/putative transposase n=1 Tax=Chitinimonas arctica TaxID=2594795 RepID=A0A516SL25_9NEIS|nr:Rpn family recombination-promoting nuclease/putative transposase [Chitinimonas arctica]QDQ28867.1 Rpn family recombination-promoting nuclease/putative transposase [Chitinimonas arctica]